MTRALVVWWEQRPVGTLSQDRSGDLGFRYGVDWLTDPGAPALSASLPKRAKAFSRKECRPFFGGLLPEQHQRDAAARVLGISAANDFAMLDRLGGDVAGALQFLAPGAAPPPALGPWSPRPLDEAGLLALLDALPARPLLAGQDGLRLSLAGAQSKVPVVLVAGKVALPEPGQATSHILKPAIAGFTHTTENEAFSMRLARAAGLEVAAVTPRFIQPPDGPARTFLLVERYDRVQDPAGILHRIHQEDFCQALGLPVERKYQSEGGPALADGFALLARISAMPATDLARLLDAVICNAVIGNADAHGKNFSVLYRRSGPRLAPLYDLLATVVYPHLSSQFAMKIGRRARLEDLDLPGWAEFARMAGLGVPMVLGRVEELAERLGKLAQPTAEDLAGSELDADALSRLADLVRARSRHCLAGLARH